MRSRSLVSLALAATAAFAVAACTRENGGLGPAPFPNTPDIYTDNFSASVNFAAFGGSKLDALSIDNAVKHTGNSSLKITVPAVGDPAGSYAGGAFVAAVPRNLSEYNVLSFWARASIPAVLNVAGMANDNTGNSLYTAERNNIALTTAWRKYSIAIPLPDLLSEEQGLFYFAEGPENGAGYEFWIDDVQFENLNTVVNVRPSITGGALLADIGGTSTITGTSVTVSVDGADQTVKAFPSYFTFTSSAPAVATVSAAGVISVLAGGTANITAKLGSVTAAGSIALTAVAPPAVAAPTPTRPAGDVISLFSGAYTNVPVTTWSASWDQADVSDVTIAGNATKKYSNLVFAGIEFPQINATAMTYLHADVYVGDASSFKIKLVDFGANGAFGGGDDREHELTLNTTTTPALTGGAWSSLDIPLSAFTGLTTRANLSQMILLGASRTAYLDNLYFYKLPAPTAPLTAAPTPTVNAANVISMFSNAYTNVTVDTWRTDWSNATLRDTTIAGNAVKKYSALAFVGIETVAQQINATAMTHFHLDIWTPDALTGGAAFKVKLVDFGANAAFAGGDDTEHELSFTAASTPALATGNWISLDLPLALFTGLANRAHIAQVILVGDDPINTVFVDNVYFYSATGIAPTVAITSGTTGTATGPVTFTFAFSADVGTSFTAGDVTVTGGTAGTLNKTNATTYTMVVTPNASATGTITVGVAAGLYTNLAGTANTAAASINQAYNTTGGGSGNVVVSFDETTAPTLSPFEGVTAASVVADPNNASNKVAMITNGVQGATQPWAGVTVSTGGQFSIPQMIVTASLTKMTVRVYSPAVGLRIRAKAENAVNPAQNHETNATTLTTVANAWETLTFDFAVASQTFDNLPTNPFNTTDTYNKLSFFLDYGAKTNTAARVFYLDDIRFDGTVGSALPLPLPVLAPTTLPAAPGLAAANVISLLNSSATYTNIAVGNWNPNWGQGGSISDTVIATKTIKHLNLVNYQGVDVSPTGSATGALDITGKNTLHISYWTSNGTSLIFSPINAAAEYAINVGTITRGAWTDLEIPINQAGFALTSIRQLKFETNSGTGNFYLDNIYFHTPVAAAPTVAITSGTAGTATGPVTFTFTFSTDVGTSFIAGDVAVTGGTAGTLNKTNATTYTMVVTPTANTAGTMTVTVGAGTFTNLAGTASTAAATINQAFNTAPPPAGTSVVSFDESTAPTLSPFEGVTAASVVADPNNAANMVAMITNGVQGAATQPYAGVTVSTGGQFSIPQMNVTASLTRMTARIWSPAVGLVIRAKAENAVNPAQNHETNATTLTTVANAWETLTFNFAVASPLFNNLPTNPFSATDPYNKLSFFFDYGTKTNTAPRIFYIDDIRFEGTVGSALPFPPPVLAPTTLAANPGLAAANVISLHNSSATYTNIAVGDWNPNWGQGGSISDFVVNTKTLKFLNLVNYQGINISPTGEAAGALNITGKNTLHISYWTADGESLKISPINAAGEYAITVSSITKNGWTELEIPINQAGFSLTSIRQLKFETTTGLGRFYLDNIYFH